MLRRHAVAGSPPLLSLAWPRTGLSCLTGPDNVADSSGAAAEGAAAQPKGSQLGARHAMHLCSTFSDSTALSGSAHAHQRCCTRGSMPLTRMLLHTAQGLIKRAVPGGAALAAQLPALTAARPCMGVSLSEVPHTCRLPSMCRNISMPGLGDQFISPLGCKQSGDFCRAAHQARRPACAAWCGAARGAASGAPPRSSGCLASSHCTPRLPSAKSEPNRPQGSCAGTCQ